MIWIWYEWNFEAENIEISEYICHTLVWMEFSKHVCLVTGLIQRATISFWPDSAIQFIEDIVITVSSHISQYRRPWLGILYRYLVSATSILHQKLYFTRIQSYFPFSFVVRVFPCQFRDCLINPITFRGLEILSWAANAPHFLKHL